MSGKFIRRTLRNVIFRNHPYFAHLALTHRCNLRCRFCHIQDTRFAELDTAGMKRIIDVLDRMGVGVLSISGGGEPLLRSDCFEILDYAAAKGLYTKITSNGTMPRERYERLLDSAVQEIAISLDGVEGNDLPYSHVGPRILETIRYLNDHLAPGKQLTLNVTVTQANRDRVDEIVAYCAREFPNAKVWLNPVVTGSGKLRSGTQTSPDPDYLDRCDSPTLLSAKFYNEGVREQHRSDVYDWGCRAGQMFFDIKPNGDFWTCQDQPSRTPLNILEPDFESKLRATDFTYRRECSGCTYSCYFVTQKGLEPRNWPDMAGLWWKANTRPDEPCRKLADRYGWAAGLLGLCASRLLPSGVASIMAGVLALFIAVAPALGQPASFRLGPEEVVAKMEESNAARQRKLPAYESVRTYVADNPRMHQHAEVTTEFRFDAPASKVSRVTQRSGSKIVQRLVIEPIISAEADSGSPNRRDSVEICRRNYVFTFTAFDEDARAFVFSVQPRRPGKYLFRGRLWIDAETFGIRRLEGEPARSPSFWVKRTHFVHEYGRFDDFWLPIRHRSDAELRLFGRSSLLIEYSGYHLESDGLATTALRQYR